MFGEAIRDLAVNSSSSCGGRPNNLPVRRPGPIPLFGGHERDTYSVDQELERVKNKLKAEERVVAVVPSLQSCAAARIVHEYYFGNFRLDLELDDLLERLFGCLALGKRIRVDCVCRVYNLRNTEEIVSLPAYYSLYWWRRADVKRVCSHAEYAIIPESEYVGPRHGDEPPRNEYRTQKRHYCPTAQWERCEYDWCARDCAKRPRPAPASWPRDDRQQATLRDMLQRDA